jgi:4'-phosphopantetheinyl transferase
MTKRLANILPGRLGRAIPVHVWAVELPEGPRAIHELEQRLQTSDELLVGPDPRLVADRVRSLVGWAALRGLIAEVTATDPGAVSLERDAHGRLLAPGHPALRASISHSGGSVLCAVVATEVGVDVEPDSRPEADEHLAQHVCTPSERQWLETQRPDRRQAALIRLWVRKEALAKALGVGLALPMGRVDVRRRVPTVDGVPQRAWSLHDLGTPMGYLTAVAVRAPRAAVGVTSVAASALPGLIAAPPR